jgi:hypothetical protein
VTPADVEAAGANPSAPRNATSSGGDGGDHDETAYPAAKPTMTNQLVRRRLHPFHHVSSISLSSKVFL